MKLGWKYAIIVNLFTILVMSVFFLIDDRKARDDLERTLNTNMGRGANIHEVANLVGVGIQSIIDVSKSPEDLEREMHRELMGLKSSRTELSDVIEIHITDQSGIILASLTGEDVGNQVGINDEVRSDVAEGEIHIGGLSKYQGHYTTAVIVPYTFDVSIHDEKALELKPGIIQILFSTSDIVPMINAMRLRHLIYVLIVSFSLGGLISISTVSMVTQPIRQLINFIARAKDGNWDARIPVSYSSDEIGKLTYELNRMLWEIQTAHESRIAALCTLARGVAHDVRNPLNLIGMAALNLKELFSDKMTPEETVDARECMDSITDGITTLSQITEQFLKLTRPNELDIRHVDLDELVDSVLTEFTLSLKNSDIKVIKNYCSQLTDMQVDSGRIRQALFNLIQNSIQAMPKGGKIYVDTQKIVTAKGESATIEIRDTGPGIPEDIRDRVFDAYFTTRESEGGLGLGLFITHQIINAHNGKIEMKSKEGMGTSVLITL